MAQRFFVDSSVIQGDRLFIQDQGIVHQISRVLRMKKGDDLILLDNRGNEFTTHISSIDKRSVEGEVVAQENKKDLVKRKIVLYQSLLKKDNFELVLQKCTELGVSEFFPVITSRTVKIKSEIPERWQSIVREAAEQSGRVFIPKLNEPKSFSMVVQQAASVRGQKNFIPHEKATDRNPWHKDLSEKIGIFIGPEGGFSEEEVALVRSHGIIPIKLGDLVLRAETAAIASVALALIA